MTLLCSMLLVAAYAQSFNIMNIVRTELAKRGLEETEVRTRLLENGIDVDSIKPSEYANYRSQVMGILDQMQAEKNGTAQADTTGNSRELLNRNYREIGYNQTAVNPPLPPQQGNNTTVELFDRNGQPIQIYDKNGKLIPSDSLSYYLDNAPWNKVLTEHRPLILMSLATVTRSTSPSSVLPRQRFTSASARTVQSSPPVLPRYSSRV